MIQLNHTYVLNPDYVLKNDINRILLFTGKHPSNQGTPGWISYLHPVQAMILSFFTSGRTLAENIRDIAQWIGKDLDTTQKIIEPFIENEEALENNWEGSPVFFPKNVLIDREKTDPAEKIIPIPLSALRCESTVDIKTQRINVSPLLMTFMLTNNCVTQCRYCYADTETRIVHRLPTERILELIRQSNSIGMQNINLIGGEIFLHKDWDVILAELIKYGYEPDLLSTKFPLTAAMIRKLEQIHFRKTIQISLDSCNEETISTLLKVNKGYLQKILNSIRLLDKSNLTYTISSVMTSYNANESSVKNLADFIGTLQRITSWTIRPAMNSLYQKEAAELKVNRDQLTSLYQYVQTEIMPALKLNLNLDDWILQKEYYTAPEGSHSFQGARCSALNNHMFVLPDGKVTICEQLYWKPQFIIGDLSTQSITEVWNSPRVQQLIHMKKQDIRKESRCHSCKPLDSCFNKDKNRCWSDILKAYGDENWDYPDPRCNKAPAMSTYIGY
ncbi:MAG: radical SAM protein [Bacteroides sp.]|nr:radical SAM protein [Bacteroides sp.]